jgi:hypothetical protein
LLEPDSKTFYFADPWAMEISAYGGTSRPVRLSEADLRRLRQTPARDRRSDGATVVLRVPGAPLCSVKPLHAGPNRARREAYAQCRSVIFGGELDIIYHHHRPDHLPGLPNGPPPGGSLFAIYDLGIKGLPEPRFAG